MAMMPKQDAQVSLGRFSEDIDSPLRIGVGSNVLSDDFQLLVFDFRALWYEVIGRYTRSMSTDKRG